MSRDLIKKSRKQLFLSSWFVFSLCVLLLLVPTTWAQVDQGTISGLVQDESGAVVSGAKVTLTNTDTGFVLERTANSNGVYVFSPVKIGNYKVSAGAPGFQTTARENLHLDIQQRLNVMLDLHAGEVSQSVTVSSSEVPLLQTQDSAVGQVISTETINNTPLNGRNWVYIAQLTAGVAPPFGNTRGSGTGDFVANGQRAEQNNFILDGVDNNTNLVDFLNGSSFVMRPPPDALAEFNLQTSNYSAEFGHSAGAVMNASIKSGTNQIHGSVWEYLRNTSLDARNWNTLAGAPVPPYHQNQFGATLGFPVLKDKLFYFGDLEVNRIAIGQPNIYTVPTPLMRQGDFSELLNPSLTGSNPIQLYQPNSGGAQTLSCGGRNNVFCPNQISPVAQNILKMYPAPNTNGGKTFNNLDENIARHDNTFQWDQRLDWNPTSKDQAYARYSYMHQIISNGLPLGPILDGSGFGGESDTNLAENFMLSETHVFTPSLTNEFRFGYNWGVFKFQQPNANNTTLAATLGLGGVPNLGPGLGGLPLGYFNNNTSTLQQWGSVGTQNEAQNVYQILDNVSKTLGNHSLKVGVSFQAIRVFDRYAPAPLGQYFYNAVYTGAPGVNFTGYGVADFLADQMNTASIANAPNINDAQWYDSVYAQDDWKITHNLTLNLGLRYDYYQPYKENSGAQANFIQTGGLGIGTGTGIYQLPSRSRNVDLGAPFLAALAQDHVALQYVDNERLATSQKLNFAPRIGFAYQPGQNTVVRGGFGLFYGGLQSQGNTNLGTNFPFSNTANMTAPNCVQGNCPSLASQGVSLETGLISQTAGGLQNFVSNPTLHAIDSKIKTPYTMNYNLSVQRSISNNVVATLSYVGNVSRHLSLFYDPNTIRGLFAPGTSTQDKLPFPNLGSIGTIHFGGVSDYNSLQAKLEKRLSHGLTFLATYTWSHALDDSSDAGGLSTAVGDRNMAIIPYTDEYTNSPYDIRHRVTLNGNYQLPFGKGRTFLNKSRWEDEVIGNWSSSLTFAAQTGTPFTVTPNNSTAAGGSARAIQIGDPFAPGGGPNCPTRTKTRDNWYNPCAFANPLDGSTIGTRFQSPVTDEQTAIALLGGRSNTIYGPGYYSINMSLFKNFTTFREQYLQFRVDTFNLLNHPTLANPSTTNNNSNGGQITAPKTFQNNTPDARFLQVSLKYAF
ncbi:TonB-dependent receptor [Granulicella sp. dw_53]|uniref:TonB-dependent receptor domain-containing protein n=1 Tax=Granulicella sp. dw_53 TaxID=2719792 RepID=UPI001BD35E9F|nr:TonB-dependent receptor [Granulicella sp. dw_53]